MNKSINPIWSGFRNAVIVGTAATLMSACATEGDSRAAQGASSGAAIGAGIGLLAVERGRSELENVFLQLTGMSGSPQGSA